MMITHFFPVLYYIAGALSLTMALLALGKKPRKMAWPFTLITLLTALWSFVYVLELTAPDLASKLFFAKIEYLAVATVPTLWLIFVVQYTGHSLHPYKKVMAALALEPAITILLAWTNESHHLIYGQILLATSGDLLVMEVIHGLWFWIHVAYSYILMTIVVALIWDQYRNSGQEGEKQAIILFTASFIPWVISFIISQITPTLSIDFMPILLTISFMIASIGLWRLRRMDVVPIARKVAIEEMSDAYLVLDDKLRILDMNRTAEASLGQPKSKLIGKLISEVAPPEADIAELLTPSLPYRQIIEFSGIFYEIHAESISQENGNRLGILAIWRDVTAYITQKRLLEERVSQLDSINHIIETINRAATLREVYEAAMQSIRETLHADKSSILLFDGDGVMKFVAWSALSEKYRKMTEGHSPWSPASVNPQPIFVEAIEQADDPALVRLKDIILEEDIRALGFVPIVHLGRVLGKFMVYYSEPHKFTGREIELLEIIAGHLAITIEKARLLEQAQNRLRRIEALRKIDAAISATLDLEHQIDILLTHVIDELQCDMSVLFLVDKASGRIMTAAAKGSYNPQMQKRVSFEIGEGGVGWIILHKKNLYIPDVRQDDQWKETQSSNVDQIVSYLGIPLIVDGEVIGVLDISTRTPREYTEEEIEFLQTLGGQAAVALKNAQLYRDLQKKVSQLRVLNDISKELMAEHDADLLLQKIVTKAMGLLDAPHGVVLLYDETKKLLTVATDSANLGHPMSMGEGLAGRVAQTRRPIILENYSQWEYRLPRYGDVPIAAAIGMPMMHGGELIGVLVVYEVEGSDRRFTEEDIRPLSLLASQAASSVFNAQLIKRLHQRIGRLQALHQISAELSKLKGAQASCQSVARLIHEKLGYDYVCIVLIDQDTQERMIVDCHGKNCQPIGNSVPKGEGLIEETIRDRKRRYWPDTAREEAYIPGGDDAQCELDVPIQSQDRLFGVLIVEGKEIDAFDQEDFDLLQTVANQLAIALENAQRMDELGDLLRATTRLYQAGQAVGKARTVAETIQTSVRSLMHASGAEAVFIHLFEAPHRMTYGVDKYDNELIDKGNERLSQETTNVLAAIRSITVLDQDQLPDSLKLQNVSRTIVFPLKHGMEIIGDILILFAREVQITPQDTELLSIYANQTTIAIEKTLSMEQATRRALEQEVVSNIVRSLNRTQDVEMAFPQLASGIQKLVAADRISLALPDEERKGFTLSVISDVGEGVLDGQWSPLEFTSAQDDVQKGQVHITPDLSEEEMFPLEKQLYQAGYRSRINLPLKVGDEILGALNIMSRTINAFTPEKLPSLLQIADALAISTANFISIRQERKRAQEMTLLYSLSRKLSSLNTMEEVATATAGIIMKGIDGVIHIKIALADHQFQGYITPKILSGPYHVWVKDVYAYPIITRIINSKAELLRISRDDPELNDAEKELLFTKTGRFAWLSPLFKEGAPMGAIIMECDRQVCPVSELQLLKSITELLMMTLHRIILFYEVEGAYLNTVLALALASDAKDSYTADHSQRLEELAVAVAQQMALSQQQIEDVRFGARLHDIGKIGVPDSVLKKAGSLTDGEWEFMRQHPEIGEKILAPLPRLRGAAKIVRHHHERYDGTGYPDQLQGEEIPILARILTVVDAYSAITDRRVYKPAQSHQEAIAEIRKNAGTQFDPEVVKVFLDLFEDSPPSPDKADNA